MDNFDLDKWLLEHGYVLVEKDVWEDAKKALETHEKHTETHECDCISRADVMQILWDYDCTNENALMVKAIKELPSIGYTCQIEKSNFSQEQYKTDM